MVWNRFKSGIFVDNFFSTRIPQDDSIGIRNLLILRRKFLDLLTIRHHLIYNLALETVSFGAGVRRTGNMLTLDYNDTNWLEQPFATELKM